MNRSTIREQAFKLLYSIEIQKDYNLEQIQVFFDAYEIIDNKAKEYITDAITGIKENEKDIIEIIKKYLKPEWQLERISKINLVLLKLAIYEIEFKKLPYKVVINEAVELSKKYGDDASKTFVNGLLASIVEEFKNAK